jgi:hypothetical protein
MPEPDTVVIPDMSPLLRGLIGNPESEKKKLDSHFRGNDRKEIVSSLSIG